MKNKRIVIAGTTSGAGKTTLTIGLMQALKQKGYVVQGFKCGPDYIDPTYHTAVTGRISRNIDSYMFDEEVLKEIFINASCGADLSIIEGVMGFYDGKSATSNKGSTADISLITNSPVLLVVNCQSVARSVAAIVKGFQLLDPRVNIVGVIANRVGSEGHYKLVKAAIEKECGVPVFGYLKRNDTFTIPERQLGLVPSIERGDLDDFFIALGTWISETIDINQIIKCCEEIPLTTTSKLFQQEREPSVSIAVAKDAAFNFYYEENLQLLKAKGANLIFFSPLKGEPVPSNVHGLYLGGGFPEEFADALAMQTNVSASIRDAIEHDLPTLAECGGFMYLTDAIQTTTGKEYPMVGVIKGKVVMQSKLAALGYREIKGTNENFLLTNEHIARGHEFHYSTFESDETYQPAYETKGLRGVKLAGVLYKQLVAGYIHFHFASNPGVVDRFIEACQKYKRKGE